MMSAGSRGEHRLQERFGTARRALAFYERQMLDHLNATMREFIARQEFVFIATADARGECDSSIRVGPPGFVHVLDAKTLLYPEYRGNGVMASLGNITENAHVGMLFVDFLDSTVGLHVNGGARVLENAQVQAQSEWPEPVHRALAAAGGRTPERWVRVDVIEAYIHCSKHIPLLEKREKTLHWGTDEASLKGGDYFRVTAGEHASG